MTGRRQSEIERTNDGEASVSRLETPYGRPASSERLGSTAERNDGPFVMTTRIGQCRACIGRPRRIDPSTGACVDCLSHRGRRWVALCIRAREDEAFRTSVLAYLDPRARKLFDAMFVPAVRKVDE